MTDLLTLLKSAKPGDTIKLPAGLYPGLGFDGYKFDPPVVITSADPANRAVLTNFNIGMGQPCSGLTFQGIDLKANLPAYGVFSVYASQHITFDQVRLYGPNGAPDPDASGLNFFDCQYVTVTNSEVTLLSHGIQVARSDHVTITGNNIHHMNSDALDFVQVSDLTVSGNALHDFYPTVGNHPDAMQFGTANSTKPSRDITIKDNLIYRGSGENTQGIFFGDELNNMPFANVTVDGNLIIGTGSSALRATHNAGLTLTGNELVTIEGGDPTVLLVQFTDQVSAIRNSAVSISIEAKNGNTNITQNGNGITLPVSQAVADARVKAWLAAHPGPWSVVAPVPAPVDPSAKYIAALKAVIALGTAANAKRAGPTKADMAGVLAVVKAALS